MGLMKHLLELGSTILLSYNMKKPLQHCVLLVTGL
jgi:hypothetical protein